MKAIWFALITSLCYGLVGPASKIAFNKGMHADGFAFTYALALLSFSVMTIWQKGIGTVYPTGASIFWGITAGVICAVGFRFSATALSFPTSLVAVVVAVGATYPLISTLVSLPLLGESAKVMIPRILLGTAFVIGGTYLVSTSVK